MSWLLLQALSRYREFAADRGSAIITGRPSALISALRKIDSGMGMIPQRDLRAASGELAAFYIFPPKAKQTVASLFSTHPPLEKRIAALERLEAQLQGTASAARRQALGPELAARRPAAKIPRRWASSTSSPAGASWRRPRRTGCSR